MIHQKKNLLIKSNVCSCIPSWSYLSNYIRRSLTVLFIIGIFSISSLFILSTVHAHDCGPVTVTMNVGETTTWQITADLTEDLSHYRPLYTGDTSIATISPDTEFYSHHGVFTITAVGVGQTSFAIEWYYEQTDAGGVCEVVVTVEESVPTPTVTPTPASASPTGLMINDDQYVIPLNNASTNYTKFIKAYGGVFIDTSCECCECPPDAAMLITSPGLVNDAPDPITLHNGEFVLQETDLKIPGRGFDWTLSRTYKSRITYDGPLGHNWDFNYNSRLIEITEDNQDGIFTETFTPVLGDSYTKLGSVIVMDGYGRSDLYGLQSDGTYSTPLGAYTRLMKNEDGSFTMRDRTGSKKQYDKNGFLSSLEDRYGNTMKFTRDENGRLTEVTDTLGRKISYNYNSDGRLADVKDFTDRTIRFEYDSNGDLVSVTSPTVTDTPNGNDFPDGKTTKYTYSSGFDDETLNHGVLTITAPNEVAVDGTPRVINVYENDSASYAYGRVVKQTYGGTNTSGIAAGGDVIYAYEELTSNPSGTNEPVNRITVTDRNVNKTVYEHNKLGNAVSIKEYTKGLREGEPEYFETSFEYNADGERVKATLPEGNEVENTFATEDAGSTDYTKSRFKHGNLLENKQTPDSNRGGDQQQITPAFTYEPIYNCTRTETDPRGNDTSYASPNGGAQSKERYTTTYYFDYQEGNNLNTLAEVMGISSAEVQEMLDEAGVELGLGDLNGDGVTNGVAGNVVKIVYPTVTLLNDSHQAQREGDTSQEIVELFTWNKYGQITSKTDPEGNVTEYDYHPENDPDGNGKNKIKGKGKGSFGYLKEVTTDTTSSSGRDSGKNPKPAKIKTQYFYDEVGNVIKETNGRGIATEYVVNELNQQLKITRAASVPKSRGKKGKTNLKAFKYVTYMEYDYNDNIVKKEVESSDSNNGDLAGDFIEYTYSYDILDHLIKETHEVSENETLVTEYRYDANENRVKIIQPEGNYQETEYDERDWVFRSTNVCGCSGGSPNTTYNYDKNGNRIETVDGEDNNGDGENDSILYEYDGFNRLVKTTDPLGNVTEQVYDPAGNVIKVSHYGAIGGESPKDNSGSKNVLLSQSEYFFDEMNRQYQQDTILFVPDGVSTVRTPVLNDGPLGTSDDGRVTSRNEFDRKGRITFTIEDDGDVFESQYDGVDREIKKIDPEGNRADSTYDEHSNLIKVVETEVTQEGNSPLLTEKFTTINAYDSLDRLVRITDNIGQTTRYKYDSRNNLISTSDPNGKKTKDKEGLYNGKINKDGNTVHYYYDGINRKIKEERDLRKGGRGNGAIDTSNTYNPDGKITITYTYDGNSRLTAITDDNGNTTQYEYDDSNRLTKQTNADGMTKTFEYDKDSNLLKATDENGSVTEFTYDAINRLVQKDITRASGVIGTTQQTFEYDGLSRLTKSFDNNDPDDTGDDVTVTYAYDSISRLLEEAQNGKAVSSQWDGSNNRLALIYPNGRETEFSYDNLDRIDTIKDSGSAANIVDYDYIGPRRILEKTYNNGIRMTFLNDDRTKDIGYDKARRPVKLRHLMENNGLIAGFEHGYDRAGNKLYETRLHEFNGKKNVGDVYTYDSVYRLTTYNRNVVDPEKSSRKDNKGKAKSDEIQTEWAFDGLGNWAGLTVGTETFKNTVNEMNEYVTFKNSSQTHNHNGNLTDDGTNTYAYDFANRLCTVSRKTDSAAIAAYTYDASGRRIRKVVSNSGDLDGTTNFYLDGWREIEERDGTDSVLQQYVFGAYIDEPIVLDVNSDGDDNAVGAKDDRLFFHQNILDTVFALTNVDGQSIKSYYYDIYGSAKVFTPDLNGDVSNVGNLYLFTGRRLDEETNLYYFRNRYYHYEVGRFIQRDPSGFNSLNLYEYVESNPSNFTDPLGLQATYPGLSVSFVDCNDGTPLDLTSAQQNAVASGISAACTTMRNALINLASLLTYQPRTGADRIKVRQLTSGHNTSRLRQMLMNALSNGCGSLTVECECSCNAGTQAYTRGSTWGSLASLHLCPPFLSTSAAEQTLTLLHELTHYGGSDDEVTDDINAHNLERLLPWLERLGGPNSPSSNNAPANSQTQTNR